MVSLRFPLGFQPFPRIVVVARGFAPRYVGSAVMGGENDRFKSSGRRYPPARAAAPLIEFVLMEIMRSPTPSW